MTDPPSTASPQPPQPSPTSTGTFPSDTSTTPTPFTIPPPSHVHDAHTDCIYALQASKNYIITGSRDTTVRIWSATAPHTLLHPPLRAHTASVLCLHFCDDPDVDILVTGGADGALCIWRLSTGALIRKVERAHESSVLDVHFVGSRLVTAGKDRSVKVWGLEGLCAPVAGREDTGEGQQKEKEQEEEEQERMRPLRTLLGHTAAVNCVRLTNHDAGGGETTRQVAISGSGDRTIKIWNLESGECIRTISGHNKGVCSLQVLEGWIYSGSSDNTIRVVEMATGTEVACLRGHSNLTRKLHVRREREGHAETKGAVKGDGEGGVWIACASYDASVTLWRGTPGGEWELVRRLSTGEALGALERSWGQLAGPRAFGVQFDGRQVLCCSQEPVVVGWELE